MEDKKTIKEQKAERAKNRIYEFVKSDGWAEVKNSLIRKLAAINSISNLVEGKTFEETVKQALLNKSVVEWVTAWLIEVEGVGKEKEYEAKLTLEEKVQKEGESVIRIFENMEE